MNRPIVIIGERRSGTSLISNIFHQHGVWVGNCRKADEFNKDGYFENIAIAKLVSKAHQTEMPFLKFKQEVIKILYAENYKDGPWLVKHYLTFWYLWQVFNPIYIKVRRNPDFIYKSLCRIDKKFKSDAIKIQNNINKLKNLPSLEIWPHKLIAGDYTQLKTIFKATKLALDESLVEKIINKKEWHYA